MAPSLKERYDERKLQTLQERARAADAQVIEETRYIGLLLEAMGQEDIQKVSAIVQKLNTIKSPELPHLSAAIEQAQAELNKYTGGGPLTAAWTKLKGLVGIDNPVVKITTFADALERGFAQIPMILKNNGVDLAKADLTKSLSTMLAAPPPTGAKGDKDMAKSPVTGNQVPDNEKINTPKPKTGEKSDQQLGNTSFGGKKGSDQAGSHMPDPTAVPGKNTGGQQPRPKTPMGVKKPQKSSADEGVEMDEAAPKAPTGDQKLKNITDQLRKALAPGGIFGAFKKVPYIDGAALAQELVAAPIKVFSNVAKRIQSGAKAAEIAPDMKDQIQGQGGEQTKGANTAEPSKPGGQTQPGQPAKPSTATTDTTGVGQQPPKGPGQQRGGGAEPQSQDANKDTAENFKAGVQKIIQATGVDNKTGVKLLKYLMDNKLIDRAAIAGHASSGGAAPAAANKPAA